MPSAAPAAPLPGEKLSIFIHLKISFPVKENTWITIYDENNDAI